MKFYRLWEKQIIFVAAFWSGVLTIYSPALALASFVACGIAFAHMDSLLASQDAGGEK